MNDINLLLQNEKQAQKEQSRYCPFIVKMYGAFYDDGCVKMILEYMDGGSLEDLLLRRKK